MRRSQHPHSGCLKRTHYLLIGACMGKWEKHASLKTSYTSTPLVIILYKPWVWFEFHLKAGLNKGEIFGPCGSEWSIWYYWPCLPVKATQGGWTKQWRSTPVCPQHVPLSTRVPQEIVLGTVLFLVYLLLHLKHHGFGDDTQFCTCLIVRNSITRASQVKTMKECTTSV